MRTSISCLFLLFLVAPFEPRFTIPLGLFQVSAVEAVALPCFAVLAFNTRRLGARGLTARPLLALGLLVVVALVSANLSAVDPPRSFKFALRVAAMAVFAALVARLDEREIRFGLGALLVAGSFAALLAVLEGAGLRGLDVFLGAFREIPFNVAGVRRSTGGSEYPNLGAAMIVYALLAGVVLLKRRPWARALLVIVLSFGLAFTYSRGAWLAGAFGLGAILVFESGKTRLAPLALFLAVLGTFVGGEEISRIRFGGENANDFYAATYGVPGKLRMESSERRIVSVTISNVGRRPWRKADQIHLSYHLYQSADRPLIDGPRTDLPRDILPGESVTMDAILRAPRNTGAYLLLWDLVHEQTTWFSGQGVRPGVVELLVGPAEAASQTAPQSRDLQGITETLGWRPSRLELWKIALRMWAANPFLGVGPDNFRWTYGTVVGKTGFDTRVFSNNMFVEIAATLGTLGLCAFAAALLFAFAAGVREAPRSDAALIALAILTAMSVHGLTDYVLAFTGHYLVFGLAIGALSRPS